MLPLSPLRTDPVRPQASWARTSPPRDDGGATARLHCCTHPNSVICCAAVERIRHTSESQGQVLALAGAVFQAKVFETF